MRGLSLALSLAVSMWACGGSGSSSAPTAPSAAGAVSQPGPAVADIFGYVLDTGYKAVAGARIEALDGPDAGASATADTTGQFTLSGTFDSATRFRATKDGYVAATQTWNCSVGAGCSATGARPWLGFYLASSVAPPVNIAGDYTVTFIADSACVDLPSEVRTRTYAATITPTSSPSSSFTLTASGAAFLANLNNFPIGVIENYVDLWLHGGHDPAVVEQLAPNTYLAFSGNATASVGMSPVSTISMPFHGWIDYCVLQTPMGAIYNCGTSNTTGEPIPGLATRYAHCESRNHQLILTRR